ncbi:hypothetical protein BLAT2472_30092 [Burkholderia latens]
MAAGAGTAGRRAIFTTGGHFCVPYKEQCASDGMEYRGVAPSIKNKFIGPDEGSGNPRCDTWYRAAQT